MGENVVANELGSWAVRYRSGEVVAQYDATHPEFCVEGGEVPYRAVQWDEVVEVRFENARVQSVFDIVHPGPEYQMAMRSRHFTTNCPTGSAQTMAFIILTVRAGVDPRDTDALRTNTVQATYWFPNGVTYTTPDFDSPEVAQYAQDLCKAALLGTPLPTLPAEHQVAQVEASAVIEP